MKSSAAYKIEAKQSLTGNWNSMILATIIFVLISFILSFITNSDEYRNHFLQNNFSSRFFLNYSIIVFFISLIKYPLIVGYNKMGLECVYGENPSLNDLFSRFYIFGKIIIFEILYEIGTVLLCLLLIFPGIYFAYTYCLVPMIFADNPDMSITEAMEESKRLISGHRMDLFILQLSFIGWVILSAFTYGLGLLYLLPYMTVTEAFFYNDLKLLNN